MNPWDAEYEPNPVLFPHLYKKSISTESFDYDRSPRPNTLARPQEGDQRATSITNTIGFTQRDNSDSASPVSSTSSAPTSYASLKSQPITDKGKETVIESSETHPSSTSFLIPPNPSQEACPDHQCQTCGLNCDTRGQLKYVLLILSPIVRTQCKPQVWREL